ncbi:MAG TPA: chemoreceptor glutamine deamidase CheD, partial [Alphaproteobacteria bacterium]|nr:chemoreceptor glutamine deamidase CheD [Alphaproteobacteria bacterium]
GGMNHFMLPESDDGKWGGASASLRFGNYAMERLVNDILIRGGRRERLEVKLMGGGKVLDNCVDVGTRNADFAEAYARAEGLAVLATDLRGDHARRVHFMPVRGRLWLKRLHRTEMPVVGQAETAYYKRIEKADPGGSVELF